MRSLTSTSAIGYEGRILFMTIRDAAFSQIVRRHFHGHPIAGQHTDPVAAQLARQVSQHKAFLVELNAEQTGVLVFEDEQTT